MVTPAILNANREYVTTCDSVKQMFYDQPRGSSGWKEIDT